MTCNVSSQLSMCTNVQDSAVQKIIPTESLLVIFSSPVIYFHHKYGKYYLFKDIHNNGYFPTTASRSASFDCPVRPRFRSFSRLFGGIHFCHLDQWDPIHRFYLG